jgi:hypothetical protein
LTATCSSNQTTEAAAKAVAEKAVAVLVAVVTDGAQGAVVAVVAAVKEAL